MTTPTIDTHSETWRMLSAWAEGEIDGLHQQLEQSGLSVEATEHARGRIKALRDLLGLGSPPVRLTGLGEPADY